MYKHQHYNMSDKSVQLIHQDTRINMFLPTLPAQITITTGTQVLASLW
jgi:hypothetical protein